MFKKFFAILICLSLLLTGCSLDYKQLLKKKEIPASNLPVNSILLTNDEIYNQTVDLINIAKKSIYVEQGLFTDERLSQLLIAKSRNGLDVRVLMDQFHTANKTTLTDLKNNQVSAQFYPARKGQNNRVKLLVVDSSQAIVYSSYWAKESWNAANMAVVLNGKSAWKLANVYNRDWEFTTTLTLDVPKTTTLAEDNIIPAANANIKQQISEQISSSNKSIWVELTELTDPDTLQALIDATAKRVDVRVILDDAKAKSTPVLLEKLKAAGIQVRFYNEKNSQPLGINFGIFDGNRFVFSSSGWTYYTFVVYHELSITVPSPSATAKLIQNFDADWQNSSQS
ncbi:phosphatidylserine/phosphatidylglycerophosphate/cardiolipin synthase family protein [Desulfitobacterium sp.]|uniref:phospholipase D-like domain-containing protein n=1 Tax=Desulfitobacterium sp. TaxID=49981 RepID=UPI002CD65365|nr:phosphatidylserine/phosphatidylglycerophosphate/cardiolipin synthase family protein [Desulfitobacterium sp.]HVJ48699.1 phosphatidylserine/phosphatidylglycerophosphate/cardiolipin synthase family protein [Desulfitobacterium sp.]